MRISTMRGWRPRAFAVAATAIALIALTVSVGTVRAQDTGVSIVDFAFDPASVTVTEGSTVTWTNSGAAPHTATGNNGEFDTGTLDSGGSASVTFDTAGTFNYFCTIHPNMTAAVTVTGADAGGDDDDNGADTGGDSDATTNLPASGIGTTAGGDGTSSLLLLAGALTALGGMVALRRRLTA